MQTLTLQAWPSVEQDTAPSSLAGKPGSAGHTHTPLVEKYADLFVVFKAILDARECVCGEVIVVT